MIADLAGSTTTPIMWDTPNRELSYAGRWLSPDSYGLGAFDPSNSRNWNRYAYALNDPLRNIDPSGLDCITANEDGSFSEEGGDCPDVDPDNEYYLNCDGCLDNLTGGYRDSSGNLVLTNGDDSVAGVVGGGGDLTDGFGYSLSPENAANNLQLAVAGGQTLQSIRSFLIAGLKQITPTVCGGGGFLFLGAQKKIGGGQGFGGALLEYDTRAGWSLSGLFEGGGSSVGGGVITKGPEGLAFVPLAEGAIYGVPAEGGALATTNGSVGAYGEVGHGPVGGGVGGYLNITTIANCEERR